MSQRKLSHAAWLAILSLSLVPIAKSESLYNFTTFDGTGDNGGGTTVNGINSNGAVVGFSSNANATVLTNFIRNPDGTFTTLNINNDPLAMANGINSGNVIVGTSSNQAFELNKGQPTFLPPVKPGDTAAAVAFGVNNASTIVGQYTQNSTDTQPGFVYRNGQFTTFQATNTALVTNAQSVNNNGIVVGFYSADGVHQHGFLLNDVTNNITVLPDPVVANLVLAQFLGVNDNGLAVGYYQTNDGSQHGFLFNTQTQAYTFLDDPNAASSGFSITQITGINDSNEIAGFYVDAATGIQRGFVGTVATPEPATIFLALGSLLPLFLVRRKLNSGALLTSQSLTDQSSIH